MAKKQPEGKTEDVNEAGLTARQAAFCEEYLLDLNATQAAIRAGYAKPSAHVEGSRQLANAKVRSRIEEMMDARSQRTLINADFVIESLKEVAHRCLQAVPVMIYDPVAGGMTQKIDDEGRLVWEFDSQGANKALELLGKHQGLFLDRSKNENDNKHHITVSFEDAHPPEAPEAT